MWPTKVELSLSPTDEVKIIDGEGALVESSEETLQPSATTQDLEDAEAASKEVPDLSGDSDVPGEEEVAATDDLLEEGSTASSETSTDGASREEAAVLHAEESVASHSSTATPEPAPREEVTLQQSVVSPPAKPSVGRSSTVTTRVGTVVRSRPAPSAPSSKLAASIDETTNWLASLSAMFGSPSGGRSKKG